MSFDSWRRFLEDLQSEGLIPEAEGLNTSIASLLQELSGQRNVDAHRHALASEAAAVSRGPEQEAQLSELLAALEWMTTRRWLFVEVCDFTEQGHTVRGQILQGSHPDWERFERLVEQPVVSQRLYLEAPRTADWLPLKPFADVQPCPRCEEHELFILDRVTDTLGQMRSLRDHDCEIPLS